MLNLRDIAVLLDGTAAGASLAQHAVSLARKHGAQLIGVHGVERAPIRPEESFVRGARAIASVAESHAAADAAKVADLRSRFAEITRAQGVAADFRAVWRDAFDETQLRSLQCDLILAAHPPLHDLPPNWSAEHVLTVLGGPVLLVPAHWESEIGRHVLIAWNASRPARRAVNDAMPLIATADKVTILIVDHASYGDRMGADPGADLLAHLARHDIPAELRLVESERGDIAGAIADQANALGADLTVIGCYSRSRTVEAIFGGVTRTMLSNAPSPLLLAD